MRHCRQVIAIAALGFTLALPARVLAHAELVSSEPAAGANLAEPPSTIVLTFDGELDPDRSGFDVLGPDGIVVGQGEVDLFVADRNVLSGPVAVDGSDGGAYTVRWTAMSTDGHAEAGSIRFTVGGGADAPDTALPAPAGGWPLGVALLAAAAGLAARVRRRRAVALVAVAVVLTACVSEARPSTCGDAAVTIEMTLTAATLTPDDPAVCRDQDVTLIVASQVDGVLHVHGYDEALPATSVAAGEELTLAFTADRSGQFPIELHPADDPGQAVELGILTVDEP
jgi:methionine-rich copper-binding protein CopC